MRGITIVSIVLILVAAQLGCARSSNPCAPESIPRTAESFATPVAVYQPSDALLQGSDGFHEIDMAELRTGWN